MRLIPMRFLVVAPALAVLAISPARAQAPGAHPDFTGVWVMDTAKSPGPMIPLAMTYAIEQHGDTIRIKRDTKTMRRGDFSANLDYGMDGKPWKNSVNQDGTQVDVSSVLTWEGSTLIITSTLNASGQEIHQVEKWSLEASGNNLVADRSVDAMGQQFSTKLVFTKRP